MPPRVIRRAKRFVRAARKDEIANFQVAFRTHIRGRFLIDFLSDTQGCFAHFFARPVIANDRRQQFVAAHDHRIIAQLRRKFLHLAIPAQRERQDNKWILRSNEKTGRFQRDQRLAVKIYITREAFFHGRASRSRQLFLSLLQSLFIFRYQWIRLLRALLP